MNQIAALQRIIGQGIRLDSVNLTANGDYSSIFDENGIPRPFLLDLPSDGNMKVQFQDGHIGTYPFYTGTRPMVKVIKVFDAGSVVKEFTAIY